MSTYTNKGIGARLADLRKEKGLSQRELANLMGYKSDATIAKWESGANTPNGGKLANLAQVLDTTTDYILFGGGNVINGDSNNIATMSGDVHGNISFGSTIRKEDLHEVASNLNLTDRELQEKTLNEVSDLKASQARLESAIALLIENQAEVLKNMKSVDDTFKEIMNRLTKVDNNENK